MNFLALLGWSPGSGDRELFERDALVAAFDLDGISGGNAVFNTGEARLVQSAVHLSVSRPTSSRGG